MGTYTSNFKMGAFNFFLVLSSMCLAFIDAAPKSICCDDRVGCFTTQKPFDKFPLPECVSTKNVKMTMYTRDNIDDKSGLEVSRDNIPSVWSTDRQTVILVHGFMSGGDSDWMIELKNLLLKKDEYNVLLVDWAAGAGNVYYPQSASNVRTAGAEVALVVNMMAKLDPVAAPYCIGHSLGAHVCAHVGMRTKLARVTGLDPAGPWFELEGESVGLNPNCADFVDAIHTHGMARLSAVLNLGSLKPMGEIDFYPNGGFWQPGCLLDVYSSPFTICINNKTGNVTPCMEAPQTTELFKRGSMGMENLSPACSHKRAYRFFIDSLKNGDKCTYDTQKTCSDSYKLPKSCGDDSSVYTEMGYYADLFDGRGVYYLTTGKNIPFCMV